MTTQIFYDSEFTGLHQYTSLISIGLVADNGEQFYAEFSDYNAAQCDDWIKCNVLNQTRWLQQANITPHNQYNNGLQLCVGDREYITPLLRQWLTQFESIEIWADCLAYDWVLFCQLFGGALYLPDNIFYMPNDLVGLFQQHGLSPETDRLQFSDLKQPTQHNALDDALIAQACYEKLTNI